MTCERAAQLGLRFGRSLRDNCDRSIPSFEALSSVLPNSIDVRLNFGLSSRLRLFHFLRDKRRRRSGGDSDKLAASYAGVRRINLTPSLSRMRCQESETRDRRDQKTNGDESFHDLALQ